MREISIEEFLTFLSSSINREFTGDPSKILSGKFRFDSRKVGSGDIFIALQGENHHGNEFIEDAYANGANLVIANKAIGGSCLVVNDVIEALSNIAGNWRKSLPSLKVIGITGSQGKTTTKEFLFSVLSAQGETVASAASFNNELGVPLTLLETQLTTKYCIVEMGARHQGDIAKLAEIARPDVGVVLKVGLAHLGEFGSQEKIAATKAELIETLSPGAIAILGRYDEFTPKMRVPTGVEKIFFGQRDGCDIRAADVEVHGGYAHFDLVTPEGREPVALRVVGEHQISNALAAAAVAYSFGIETRHIAASLSAHELQTQGRMEIGEYSDVTVINDSYNANPESMKAAINTLALISQERGGRSWALLGRMNELGISSFDYHQELAKFADQSGIDFLISIGTKDYLFDDPHSLQIYYCNPATEVEKFFASVEGGDVVLIKASRSEKLEFVSEKLISHLRSLTILTEGDR
jgi:UDP-N-acetylmuramoyl-tripeptide--D-alanyl-D-alanine ligase